MKRVSSSLLAVVAILSACGSQSENTVVATIDSTWRSYQLPNVAFSVTLPAGFRPRNVYGCYNAVPKGPLIPLTSIRDVCVEVASRDVAELASLQRPTDCDLDLAQRSDCAFYEEVSADTLTISGRFAIVERGLRTGAEVLLHAAEADAVMLARMRDFVLALALVAVAP